jgi:hypothetical protein
MAWRGVSSRGKSEKFLFVGLYHAQRITVTLSPPLCPPIVCEVVDREIAVDKRRGKRVIIGPITLGPGVMLNQTIRNRIFKNCLHSSIVLCSFDMKAES